MKHVKKFIRQIRQVSDFMIWVVDCQRVDGLDLNATDTSFFHGAHFTLQFPFLYCGTKPPPTHHDAGVIGWSFEGLLQFSEGSFRISVGFLCSERQWAQRLKYQQKKENERVTRW